MYFQIILNSNKTIFSIVSVLLFIFKLHASKSPFIDVL
jgi:hypothetical protein